MTDAAQEDKWFDDAQEDFENEHRLAQAALNRKCVKTSTWMYLDGGDDDPKQSIGHDGD